MRGKYPTDEGDFSIVPKEVKSHIFRFLNGSPNVSLVCKNFKDANNEHLRSLLPLMEGKVHKMNVYNSRGPSHYNVDLCYNTMISKEKDIEKFFKLLMKNLSNKGFLYRDGASSHYISGFNCGPHFHLYIKKEGLQEFLKYIDELKIKSNDCKVEKTLGIEVEEFFGKLLKF